MIEKKPSNSELVYDAIVSMHAAGKIVSRRNLMQVMDLKPSIIDDRLKALANDKIITREERGVYVPSESYPPARVISAKILYGDAGSITAKPDDRSFGITRMPDATVIIDIYDYVLKLIPSELRALAQMLQPFATGGLSASVVVVDVGDDVFKLIYEDAVEIAKLLIPYAFDAYSLQMKSQTTSAIMDLMQKVKALEALASA